MVLRLSTTRVEVLIWVFIYGGLLLLGVGLALQREHDALGWSVALLGSALVLLGIALIWLRSRMHDPGVPPDRHNANSERKP